MKSVKRWLVELGLLVWKSFKLRWRDGSFLLCRGCRIPVSVISSLYLLCIYSNSILCGLLYVPMTRCFYKWRYSGLLFSMSCCLSLDSSSLQNLKRMVSIFSFFYTCLYYCSPTFSFPPAIYRANALPSAGVLPFMQTMMCDLSGGREKFLTDMPQYPNAS